MEVGVALQRQTLALADHLIVTQPRALPRQELDHVHAELSGALIDEGERQVHLAAFACDVLVGRATRRTSHLLDGKVVVLAQRADAAGDVAPVVHVDKFHGLRAFHGRGS